MTATGALAGAVVAGALVFAMLAGEGPRSLLAWLQYPLFGALALGLAMRSRHARRVPAPHFVTLSWALGMAFEATLTVDGGGIGGVHPDTLASFLLAQGDYLPLALAFWALRRWGGLGLAGAFWAAGGAALTEGLVFTGSLLAAVSAGPAGAALTLAYLWSAYALFLALPLRILGAEWGRAPPWALPAGFAAAFAVRLFWGLAYAPAMTALIGIPP